MYHLHLHLQVRCHPLWEYRRHDHSEHATSTLSMFTARRIKTTVKSLVVSRKISGRESSRPPAVFTTPLMMYEWVHFDNIWLRMIPAAMSCVIVMLDILPAAACFQWRFRMMWFWWRHYGGEMVKEGCWRRDAGGGMLEEGCWRTNAERQMLEEELDKTSVDCPKL